MGGDVSGLQFGDVQLPLGNGSVARPSSPPAQSAQQAQASTSQQACSISFCVTRFFFDCELKWTFCLPEHILNSKLIEQNFELPVWANSADFSSHSTEFLPSSDKFNSNSVKSYCNSTQNFGNSLDGIANNCREILSNYVVSLHLT